MLSGPTEGSRMLRSVCGRVFKSAYDAVAPDRLVAKALRREGNKLIVTAINSEAESQSVELDNEGGVYLAAFGKASLGMTRAVQDTLGVHTIRRGFVNIQYGTVETLQEHKLGHLIPHAAPELTISEGARNNMPDAAAEFNSALIEDMAKGLGKHDTLITLVSGGGSALLASPVAAIPLADKLETQKQMVAAGASIQQLNTVRQNISRLKNGGLAAAAYPAQVVGLIFSDIIENDLHFVASGPTVPPDNKLNRQEAWAVLLSLGCADTVPRSVAEWLQAPLSVTASHQQYRVLNALVGDNQTALRAALSAAEQELPECSSFIVRHDLSGEAAECGRHFADWFIYAGCDKTVGAPDLSHILPESFPADHSTPFLAIFGGETTVNINGSGKGGRNQEMVLAFLLRLADRQFKWEDDQMFCFMSAGTDGQDGPTDQAGVVVDERDVQILLSDPDLLEEARHALHNNDSYNFFSHFRGGKCFVHTGLTGTNVMDIQILAVQ